MKNIEEGNYAYYWNYAEATRFSNGREVIVPAIILGVRTKKDRTKNH